MVFAIKTRGCFMLETKIVEVADGDQQRVIDNYQYFGWRVLCSQKIDYRLSYTTGGGDAKKGYKFVVHNERTSYYILTFQRDTKMKGYSELESLFRDYERLESRLNGLIVYKLFPVAAIVFLVVGALINIALNIGAIFCYIKKKIGLGVICMLLGVGILIGAIILAINNIKFTRSENFGREAAKEIKRKDILSQMADLIEKAKSI